MAHFIVRPLARPLAGSVPVVSDKSIGHRALLLGALAKGQSSISGFSYGADNLATLAALRQLGTSISESDKGRIQIQGRGKSGFEAPEDELDCGNSGTTMRLLTGLLVAQPFSSRLVGDESLSKRPMGRIVDPLRHRGARISGAIVGLESSNVTAPLLVSPLPREEKLAALQYRMPISSAQVKSALLLSGLYAEGPTVVESELISRDHTERMLDALGAKVETVGPLVKLSPLEECEELSPFTMDLPGDLSAAAFLLCAAALNPDSRVTVRDCGINPTRMGVVDALKLFGCSPVVEPRDSRLGEPVGNLSCRGGNLAGFHLAGELALRAIDEIPILAAVASRAVGTTTFSDLGELRVKESDRIASSVELLEAFGLEARQLEDGMVIQGKPSGVLKAAEVDSHGDHRIAMTAVVLGLYADGPSVVRNVDCVATSFPRFAGTLRALGADVTVHS